MSDESQAGPKRGAAFRVAAGAALTAVLVVASGCEIFCTGANGVCESNVVCDDAGECSTPDGGTTAGFVVSPTFAPVAGCNNAEAMRLPAGRWAVMGAADGVIWLGDFSRSPASFLRVSAADGKTTSATGSFGFSIGATSQGQGFRVVGHRLYWLDKQGGRAVELNGDAMAASALTVNPGTTGFDVSGNAGYYSEPSGNAWRLQKIDLGNRSISTLYTETAANARGSLLAVVGNFAIVNVEGGPTPGLFSLNLGNPAQRARIESTVTNRAYGDGATFVWSATSGAPSTFKYGPAANPGNVTQTRSFSQTVGYALFAPTASIYFAGSKDASVNWALKADLAGGTVVPVSLACTMAGAPAAILDAIAVDSGYVYVASENSSDSAALWRYRR